MFGKLLGAGALSPSEFTALLARRGVEQGYFEDPQVDLEAMTIVARDGQLSLRRIYDAYVKLPRKERPRFIDDVLAAFDVAEEAASPPDWDTARSKLVPSIRDAGYLACAAIELGGLGTGEAVPEIASREIAPGLFTTLTVDDDNHMVVVTKDMLAAWGVQFETALQVGLGRLENASDAPFQQVTQGLWAAPWADSYTAARLLLPDLLLGLCASPLVAIPDRNTLLVADPAVPGVFEDLVDLISQADDPYRITRRVFQLQGETLCVFALPRTEAGAALERMILEDTLAMYENEKRLHLQNSSSPEVLIRLKAFEREEGTFTMAIWTQGVENGLLPLADVVMFQAWDHTLGPRGGGESWIVPWSQVVATPSLVTATMRPLPRWRCGGFPSRAWLEQHGQPLRGA